jgi:hypothetical protein
MAYRRLPRQEHEEDTTASPEGTRIFVIAIMTAVILGFLSGLFWVAWNLLLYVFR